MWIRKASAGTGELTQVDAGRRVASVAVRDPHVCGRAAVPGGADAAEAGNGGGHASAMDDPGAERPGAERPSVNDAGGCRRERAEVLELPHGGGRVYGDRERV